MKTANRLQFRQMISFLNDIIAKIFFWFFICCIPYKLIKIIDKRRAYTVKMGTVMGKMIKAH